VTAIPPVPSLRRQGGTTDGTGPQSALQDTAADERSAIRALLRRPAEEWGDRVDPSGMGVR
jgi:hypothetical protein